MRKFQEHKHWKTSKITGHVGGTLTGWSEGCCGKVTFEKNQNDIKALAKERLRTRVPGRLKE